MFDLSSKSLLDFFELPDLFFKPLQSILQWLGIKSVGHDLYNLSVFIKIIGLGIAAIRPMVGASRL